MNYTDWLPATMADKITGENQTGIWFQTFYERRFWPVGLGEDKNGRLRVMRPLLDISISYVDQWGNTLLDRARPPGVAKNPDERLVPYSPHTIGKADIFRTIRVARWLKKRNRRSHGASSAALPENPE